MKNISTTQLDFDQIKHNLKEYMKGQESLKDYDFEGSTIATIIDVLAYNTFYSAFNAQMMANEAFLDSAQIRNNVVAHARMLGYVPRSYKAATALVDVIPSIGTIAGYSRVTMPRGTLFQAKVGNEVYPFVTLNDYFTEKKEGVYIFSDVKLHQGILRTYYFNIDKVDENQRFTIPDNNIDIDTLIVKVKDTSESDTVQLYSNIKSIIDVDSKSFVYSLEEGSDGYYNIFFGDDVIGVKLQPGNVVIVEYLVTRGPEVNGAHEFNLGSDNIAGYQDVSVITKRKASGGSERETLDSIKYNGPLTFLAQNRLVTINDYKAIIKNEYQDIESISAWGGEDSDPKEYGKVFVSIKPKTTETLGQDQKNYILDNIVKLKSLASVKTEIVDPEYTYLNLDVSVTYNSNETIHDEVYLNKVVYNEIKNYNNSLNRFEGYFRTSNLLTAIDNSNKAIKSSDINITLMKKLIPRSKANWRYELIFVSSIKPDTNDYQAIYSSEFVLNGEQCVILSNKKDDKEGNLSIYKKVGNNYQKVYNNIGTINYKTGKLILPAFSVDSFYDESLNPIGTEQNRTIKFFAQPIDFDLYPKNNHLLSINLKNLYIKMFQNRLGVGF